MAALGERLRQRSHHVCETAGFGVRMNFAARQQDSHAGPLIRSVFR